MESLTLRKVTAADRVAVFSVERRTMPQWQYLEEVFDLFFGHERGEFTVCELDGEVVACAKFTVLPDNSAWLETIRVVPEKQGLGIGKRFYENYLEIAEREGIDTLRMYTGTTNAVSKGLAERYGHSLSETFGSMSISIPAEPIASEVVFEQVSDPQQAAGLIMPHAAVWGHYLVMNRTFYRLTPILCGYLAGKGMVYANQDSVVVLGARFMPGRGLHLGFFAGNTADCLAFAQMHAEQADAPQITCQFPVSSLSVEAGLLEHNWVLSQAQFIVMERYWPREN